MWVVKSMILVARGKKTEPRVLVIWASRAKVLIFWYPVPGSRVSGTRPLGARFGGIVVTSTENINFWYRYVGTVATGIESVDCGYPNLDILVSLAVPKCS